LLSAQLCLGALLSLKRGMNQMDIHRVARGQTASKMTALRAMTQNRSNHGTLGWHC
jgi:hypothetical protein